MKAKPVPIGELISALQRIAEQTPDAVVYVWGTRDDCGNGYLEVETAQGQEICTVDISAKRRGAVTIKHPLGWPEDR
jgi:hypothetical protein